jgi:5-methylcytosine-specific restriction protein A
MSNALCVLCIELEARITPARVVDHVKPHKGDMVLFWDENNWQALCVNHHSSHKQRLERSGQVARTIGEDGWPIDDVVIPRHLQSLSSGRQGVIKK